MRTSPWISIAEFAECEGWTERHVRRVIEARGIRTRLSEEKGRNGKRSVQCHVSSLSFDGQKNLMQQRMLQGGTDSAESQLALIPVEPVPAPKALVDPEDEKQADERYEKIKLLDRWFREGWRPIFAMSDGTAITSSDHLVKFLAAEHHISGRTLWNYYRRFKKEGRAGLANKTRSDNGESRFFEEYPKAAEFIVAEYLSERSPSFRMIHEALDRNWPKLYNHGSRPCSYSTVVAYLKTNIPNAVTTFAREGEDAYDNRHQPCLRRDFNLPPNAVWVSDHRKIDVFAYNDLFPFYPRHQWVRLQWTGIIDMRSRVIVGWSWSVDPSWRSIASALRMALERYGKPQVLLTDNGKDFKKIGRVDMENPALSGVLTQLGIKQQFAIKFNAQAKMIESFNSTMSKRFDAIWGAAYAGHNAKERSEDNNIALRRHQLYLAQKLKETPLPRVTEVIRVFEAWLDGWYHTHEVDGTGMNGRTPFQVMDEEFPEAQRQPIDVRQVPDLFWERKQRQLTRGTIQLNSTTYTSADAESDAGMRMHDGEEVAVVYDPYNMTDALVCTLEGKFIARVQSQQLLAHGPSANEAIAIHMQRNNATKRGFRELIRTLGVRHQAQGFGDLEFWRDQAGVVPQLPQLPPPTALPTASVASTSAALAERLQPEDIAEQALLLEEN